MNKDFADRWAFRLRDPDLKKSTALLYRSDGSVCALGAAELVNGTVFVDTREEMTEPHHYVGGCTALSKRTQEAAEMFNGKGSRRDGQPIVIDDVSYLNIAIASDSGVPFTKIADYIEENYEAL
jgi:hypothetical protein